MSGSIEIVLNLNIAAAEADVIVNAANTHLLQGSGVCGAIFQAAGADDLQRACDMIGHCKVGSAVMTPAYQLKASYIAHAVGPKWFGGDANEPEQLYGAYKTSLTLAREYKCHSIVFPLLSTGVYKYPVDKAWIKAIEACRDFLKENPDWDMAIRFAVLDQGVYEKGLAELARQQEQDAAQAPAEPAISLPKEREPGFPELEEVLFAWYANEKKDPPYTIINTLLFGLKENVGIYIPVVIPQKDPYSLTTEQLQVQLRNLTNPDGTFWIPVFTSEAEIQKGEKTDVIAAPLVNIMVSSLEDQRCQGIVINPWGNAYTVPAEICERLLQQAAPTQDEVDLNKGADAYAAGDYKTAAEYYLASASAGNTIAMSNLGYCFYYGRHTEVNKTAAKAWWEKAAVLGQDIAAIYRLGDMYRNGDLPEDLSYSRQLYLHAFALSQANPDMHTFPDICLRILKYCSEGLSPELLGNLAAVSVQAFEKRLEGGDRFCEESLREAKELALKYPVVPSQEPKQ